MIGNKMTLQYKVDKQVLERLDDNIVVEKSLNFLYVKFIFSDEWRGLTKYALFNYIDIDSPYKLEVNKDGIVKVPYDLITFPGFLITLQGVNKSGVRITTETRMVDVQLLGTIDAGEKAVKYVTSDNNTINIDKKDDELDLGIETQLEYAQDTHTLNLYAITHNEKDGDGEPIEVETLLSSVVLDNLMSEVYVVQESDYTLPDHYDASRGNDLYGWMTNGKITFSEDFAKVLKETKRPICISMDILNAWCPYYYDTNDAYEYVIFTPASSNSLVDGSGEEEYDVDEVISYEAQENTYSVFGILIDYTPKLTFTFSKHVTGFPINPKQVTADVYDSEILFEMKSKAKTGDIFEIEIHHDDFNKLKYNGHLEVTTRSLVSGVNEIMCGVIVYDSNNDVDIDTAVIFSRPSLYGDYYCTPTILFYDFYVRAEMLKIGGVDTVRFIRVDKPTYTLTLTNFNKVSEDGTYPGWDCLDMGKIEFIFGQEQLDDFVTKVANIVTTYYPSISTPTNMYDVVGVLNTLFDYDLTYADASSPIIPFALCQLIASARSVTNINITQTKIIYHNIQTSCDLDNRKMDIIAFSDFSNTIGGDSLVEDADSNKYYRLVGHWEFA